MINRLQLLFWYVYKFIKKFLGYCHIGKTDINQSFRPQKNDIRIFEGYNLMWILTIHKLIEQVDEFRQNGIPFFR